MYASHLRLSLLLVGFCGWTACADEPESGYRTELRPRLAAFYVIDENGRSVEENPVAEVISSPNAGATRPVPRIVRPEPPAQAPTVLSIRIEPPQRDVRNAMRCERHGLFYTRHGRCRRPLLERAADPPPSPPKRAPAAVTSLQ